MNYGIAFTPLVPAIVLWLALAAIVVVALVLLVARARDEQQHSDQHGDNERAPEYGLRYQR